MLGILSGYSPDSVYRNNDADSVAEAGWKGMWIGPAHGSDQESPNAWYCFRKTFDLNESIDDAIARIAVDSKYWMWLNDSLIVFEGGLKRGPRPGETYYDVVQIPDMPEGNNTIAVLLWYWGKDGFSHQSSGEAGICFEMSADGDVIFSDSTWRVLRHPAYGETADPRPNFRLSESNIHFDARHDVRGWFRSGYNDSTWCHAVEHGSPPCLPWNTLHRRPIPLWHFTGIIPYDTVSVVTRPGNHVRYTCVLPCNMTVTPYLQIRSGAGVTIGIQTDNYGGGGAANIRAEYITRHGLQEFESFAYFNGHEVLYDMPREVDVIAFGYRESRFDTDFLGSFSCDDDDLNTLWEKARITLNINMRDGIQDPDRERAQWWGDAVHCIGQILYACDTRAHDIIHKAILNLIDWRKPDGILYSPIPAGTWSKELPTQMLAAVGMFGFYTYYLYTADIGTIRSVYPHVKTYLSHFTLDQSGLVVEREGDWNWIDWGDNIDGTVIYNAWYAIALNGAARMAHALGLNHDAEEYLDTVHVLTRSINRETWTDSGYCSSGYTGPVDDRANGLAVLAGFPDTTRWRVIGDVLLHRFHASPYFEKYVLEALFRMGKSGEALNRMKSRYRRMIESPVTSLWEHWWRKGGSYNHGWSGGILTLLSRYVAGVAPIRPGFHEFGVYPQLGDLTMVDCTVPTVRGMIQLEIRKKDNSFSISLDSPPDSYAFVGMPANRSTEIDVNGDPIWSINDGIVARKDESPDNVVERCVCYLYSTPDYHVVGIPPGSWRIVGTRSED